MKTTFHPLVKSLMVGLTALSLSGAALVAHAAEPAPAPAPAPAGQVHADKGEHHGNFAEHMAKRQARLHDKLKLTAAQEPAWTAFIAAAAPRPHGERPAHQEFAKLNAPERMEKFVAMSKQRVVMQEGRLAALKTFYATLTPEQQKVMDHSVPDGKRGHWGDRHGPRGHGERS